MASTTLWRTIIVDGFSVEVHDFSYASFYYPSFNGNAEFPVSSKGFKRLRAYLRTVKWAQRSLESLNPFEDDPAKL